MCQRTRMCVWGVDIYVRLPIYKWEQVKDFLIPTFAYILGKSFFEKFTWIFKLVRKLRCFIKPLRATKMS